MENIINKKQVLLHIIILIATTMIITLFITNINYMVPKDSIYSVLCIIGVMIFLMCILSYKRIKGTLFTAFFLYMCSFFFFSFGQSAVSILIKKKELFNDIRRMASEISIIEAQKHTIYCIILFYLGWLIVQLLKKNQNKLKANQNIYNDIYIYKSLRIVGVVLLAISIFPALKELILVINLGLTKGYSETTTVIELRSSSDSILGAFFIPSMFMLIIGNRDYIIKRKFWTIIMMIYSLIYMLIGDRGTGAPIILSIIWVYTFLFNDGYKINIKKTIIPLIILLLMLPVISNARLYLQNSNTTYLDVVKDVLINENIIIMAISEMGFSMFPLIKVMELMPMYIPYAYGAQYLDLITNLIPSIIYKNKSGYQSLAEWLKRTLNMRWGPGFSLIAESYFNFGKYGMVIMLLEGILFTLILDHDSPKIMRYKPVKSLFISLCMIKLIDSSRRNITLFSFAITYNIALPCLIVIVLAKILRERSNRYENNIGGKSY